MRPRTNRPSNKANPDPRRSKGRRGLDRVLLLILAAAFALRLWGITDRLPSHAHADSPMDDSAVDEGDRRAMKYAWAMWWGGTHALQLNPTTGDWPGLPFYLTLGSQMAYRVYDLAVHPGSDAVSFRQRMEAEIGGMFLAARLPSVALGTLSVYLSYLLGLQLGGRALGLAAAAILAVLPFHIVSSQRIADPNLLSLVFLSAASLATVRLRRTRNIRDSAWAGVFVGLGGASKYVPLVLAGPLAMAHLVKDGGAGPLSGLRLRWRALAVSLAAILLAFAIASPFTILDARAKLKDMRSQETILTSEWAGVSARSGTLLTYLTRTLPDMMTWAGYLLALVGCVTLWRRGAEGCVTVLMPAVFILALGTLGQAQPRFILPVVGVLTVACAFGIESVGALVGQRFGASMPGRPIGSRLAAGMAGALVLVLLGTTIAMQRERLKPDSRHAAYDWAVRSIGPNETVGLDLYGPVFRTGTEGRRGVVWPFYTAQSEYVESAFHVEWLDGLRYYITSSEVSRRFAGNDPRYEGERRFYEWIRTHGARIWTNDPRSTSGPTMEVYRLPAGSSTVGRRDSLWSIERPTIRHPGRIARWIADLSQDFLLAGDGPRASEWARRGLELRDPSAQSSLLETLTMAELQSNRFSEAEAAAHAATLAYPENAMFHVLRAMALEGAARREEALAEFRLALPLSLKDDARRYVEASIVRLARGAESRR